MATGISEKEQSSTSQRAASPCQSDVSSLSAADAGFQFFFEDEIYRIDKKGRVTFGLVMETCDSFSGDEEDDYEETLEKGEVRVSWYPDGKEYIVYENAIGLADRTLMPGDVVRRMVPGQETQRGYCREISMRADVQVLGTKYVIQNVPTERLRLISVWQRDSAVCLDSWVGSTKDVEEKAILKSFSGTRFEIYSSDFYLFKECQNPRDRNSYSTQVFFPGNIVSGRPPPLNRIKLLTPEKPLHTNKKGKPLKSKFVVESLYTESVWINWQCKALSEENNLPAQNASQQPCGQVSGEDLKRLKRLNLFESCMQQLSDRNYLTYSKFDKSLKKTDWEKEQAIKFQKLQCEQRKLHFDSKSFVNTPTSSASHHNDKSKKRYNHNETDKSYKSKKHQTKGEKWNSSLKDKDKDKLQKTDNTSNLKSTSVTDMNKTDGDIDWISDDNAMEEEIEEHESNETGSALLANCSTPTSHYSPKHNIRRHAGKKNSKSSKTTPLSLQNEFNPKDGDELVVETLLVSSTVTVVWQDGTIEDGIPSTDLYPIHHLDNHEFFPGDYVASNKQDADVSQRDYGVVQTVDYAQRTARMKWFTTYTSSNEPKPTYKGESEVSVYDLKDHTDFQYRPGTMVIRVANFVGEDSKCTAGQIIDNYPDGRSKVWWVDGHISMCYPQDLFEVGQIDGHPDWDNESVSSWETESETSLASDISQEQVSEAGVLLLIFQAKIYIKNLERMFRANPNIQNAEIMKKMYGVYKSCRYLDRIANTKFFVESHFKGLIKKVRLVSTQMIAERAQSRLNRLFNKEKITPLPRTPSTPPMTPSTTPVSPCTPLMSPSTSNFEPQKSDDPFSKAIANEQQSMSQPPNTLYEFKKINPTILNNEMAPKKWPLETDDTSKDAKQRIEEYIQSTTEHNKIENQKINDKNYEDEKKPDTVLMTDGVATEVTMANVMMQAFTNDLVQLALNYDVNPEPVIKEINCAFAAITVNLDKAYEKSSQCKSARNFGKSYSQHSFSKNICEEKSTNDSGKENSTLGEKSTNDSGEESSSTCGEQCTIDNNVRSRAPCTLAEYCNNMDIKKEENDSQEMVCARLCWLLGHQLTLIVGYLQDLLVKLQIINGDTIRDAMKNHHLPSNIEENNMEVDEQVDEEEHQVQAAVEPIAVSDCQAIDLSKELPTECLEQNESISITGNEDIVEHFEVLSETPTSHFFYNSICQPANPQPYFKAIQREHRLLRNSLPPGVWVKVFEDRIDLLSVMIEGPKKTPYEDGLFLFDMQLGRDYPKRPPQCHYISFCSDRLNPNLYEDGKVCVSLLGTWSGKDTEVWGSDSTLLQVIVSIQGLILVAEPYYNEAGYEKQKGSQQGKENSRMYNEMAIIKLVQATIKMMQNPPEIFEKEIVQYFLKNAQSMYTRIKGWADHTNETVITTSTAGKCASNEKPESLEEATVQTDTDTAKIVLPEFSLLPASRGFSLSVQGLLETFKAKLNALKTSVEPQVAES